MPPTDKTEPDVVDLVEVIPTPAPERPRWLDYLDVEGLIPDPRNPKDHALDELRRSMQRFGYVEPVVLDERTGMLVSGHGRREQLLEAKTAGRPAPEGIIVTADGTWLVPVNRGWSSENDNEALAFLIAANALVPAGGWHNQLLADSLVELQAAPLALDGIGFDSADLDRMLQELAAPLVDEPERPPSDGALLAAADVTVGEPAHKVAAGDVYRLGRHTLVCADLMTQHALWRPYLTDDVLFCPYPGPFVALGSKVDADHVTLLLVQPDPYIAGHVIDKWAAIYGEATVEALATVSVSL